MKTIKMLNKKLNTKQLLKVQEVKDYIDYAKSNNSSTNTGAKGRSFELLTKIALGTYNFSTTAKQGYIDIIKYINGKPYKFEVKSGGGVVALCREDKPYKTIGEKNDYIIYTPYVYLDCNILEYAYIIDAEIFYNKLIENNLIKYNSRDNCYNIKYIQSSKDYLNNKQSKSLKLILDILDTYGDTLENFICENEIEGTIL